MNMCEHCEKNEARMYLDGYLYCSQDCAQECASQGCWSSLVTTMEATA